MNTDRQDERISRKRGGITIACRFLGSALVASPLVDYANTIANGGNGDAYRFFVLLVLGAIGGLMLIVNSLFCMIRYRQIESLWVSLVFFLVGLIGLLVAGYFLPQFRM